MLAFDNNITVEDIRKEADKFMIKDNLYCILPHKLKYELGEKDAPVDGGLDLFTRLANEDKYRIPGSKRGY
ncbi:hypothetical protein D3C80_2197600 [compost metagenome]